MGNKVSITFENNEFNILINENIVSSEKHMETAIEKFKDIIKKNLAINSDSWENREAIALEFNDKRVEINSDYKSISFDNLKYFYNSNKCFYMENGKMIPLIGGFYIFTFIVRLVVSKEYEDYKDIVNFCDELAKYNVTYRTNEEVFTVASAAFNYGSAEYNFASGKIHKGASVVKGSFNEYKEYVLSIIK